MVIDTLLTVFEFDCDWHLQTWACSVEWSNRAFWGTTLATLQSLGVGFCLSFSMEILDLRETLTSWDDPHGWTMAFIPSGIDTCCLILFVHIFCPSWHASYRLYIFHLRMLPLLARGLFMRRCSWLMSRTPLHQGFFPVGTYQSNQSINAAREDGVLKGLF